MVDLKFKYLCLIPIDNKTPPMSESEFTSLSLEGDREFWVDIEVPYGKIREKWDEEYERRIRDRLDGGLLHERILDLYFELIGQSNRPDDPVIAFEQLVENDERLGYNLCAQHEFAYGKNLGIVKNCAYNAVAGPVADTPVYSIYLDAYDALDKVTLTALIQLFDTNVLKDILGLNYCHGKGPRTLAQQTTGGVLIPQVKSTISSKNSRRILMNGIQDGTRLNMKTNNM